MGRERIVRGGAGERMAASYLKKKGFSIVERNHRTIFGETDIVAKHKGTLVFVEVKTRTSDSFGPPYLAVTQAKQNHMIKNALIYLKNKGLYTARWRIDVVSVMLDGAGGMTEIKHFENAVEDPYI
jgi:putative endonuclease